jgi:hypothetical protein
MIVMELKSKNTELTETLRASREQKKAAADALESLKADNEVLRSQIMSRASSGNDQDENRVVPYQQNASVDNKAINEELAYYKTVVEQLMNDRAVFTQRLGELMEINTNNVGAARNMKLAIKGPHYTNEVAAADTNSRALITAEAVAADTNSRALVTTGTYPNAEEQLRNLAIENSELAQRLGGAVAEKEFAMSSESLNCCFEFHIGLI